MIYFGCLEKLQKHRITVLCLAWKGIHVVHTSFPSCSTNCENVSVQRSRLNCCDSTVVHVVVSKKCLRCLATVKEILVANLFSLNTLQCDLINAAISMI